MGPVPDTSAYVRPAQLHLPGFAPGARAACIQQNELEPIGPPSALEYAVPIWGSGRASINSFQEGQYLSGTFNGAMAMTDFFVVKALATGGVKLAVGGGVRLLTREVATATATRAGVATTVGMSADTTLQIAANYDQGRDLLDLNGERIFSAGLRGAYTGPVAAAIPSQAGWTIAGFAAVNVVAEGYEGNYATSAVSGLGLLAHFCTQKSKGVSPQRPNLLNYQVS